MQHPETNQKPAIVIEWDGQETPIGIKRLSHLIAYSSDFTDKAQYIPLTKALYELDYPSLGPNWSFYLPLEQSRKAWLEYYLARFQEWDVENTVHCMTDEMADVLIKMDDPRIIPQWVNMTEHELDDDYSYDDFRKNFPKAELSKDVYDKLLEHIRDLNDRTTHMDVESEEYENYNASDYTIHEQFMCSPFFQMADRMSLVKMTMDDAGYLEKLNLCTDVVDVSDIDDEKTRVYVREYCLNSHDPINRLALAKSEKTPKDTLEKLTNDSDCDVAAMAKKTLAEWEKGE